MESSLATPDALTKLCGVVQPADTMEALLAEINRLMPDLNFRHVLTRRGWHRLGGVVDKDHGRVARNIVHWIDEECDGDVDELIARYDDSGYLATRLAGRTHFFTAKRGDDPRDFVQIEIEELQERVERPLIASDWFPDSVEEFLEPLEHHYLEPVPVDEAYYQFRRITPIAQFLAVCNGGSRLGQDINRFVTDWQHSSAGDHEVFSEHWVMSLREYKDRNGDLQLTAKPVPTFIDELPELPDEGTVHGADLANAIHGYDRHLGYPFAWYFMMLTRKASNYALAEAVLADQMGAYAYLPAKDLKVLRAWEQRPYGV